MANFRPLKQNMLMCLNRFIADYGLCDPFLEVGCGTGDVSGHLAKLGWRGTAIDFSDTAIARATTELAPYPDVAVRQQSLADVSGRFATVLMWDVLEHIDDDRAALHCAFGLLEPGGHLLLAVPSNPREWRWDDDFYGHVRRYTVADLEAKLTEAGFRLQATWDFTFPMYWAMRRAYTRLKSPVRAGPTMEAATRASATSNAWNVPVLSGLLDRSAILWHPLNALQFRCFRHMTGRGHEFFALAQKPHAGSQVQP